jgi:co-chaperonin GroES (HSP10)
MSERKFMPVGHRVLVRLEEVTEKAGLIYKPDTVRDREQRVIDKGTVEAVGPTAFVGFADGSPWCAVGDFVAFAKNSGVLMEQEGKFYRVINDEDIYARAE